MASKRNVWLLPNCPMGTHYRGLYHHAICSTSMLDIFCAAVYSRVLAIWVQKPIVQDLSVFLLLLYYGPTFYHPPWKTWKEGGGTFLVALVCFGVICFKSLCKIRLLWHYFFAPFYCSATETILFLNLLDDYWLLLIVVLLWIRAEIV